MTREELVPHIAKAIRPKWLGVPDRLISDIAGIVLDHAVWIAENFPVHDHGNLATAPYAAAEQIADEIAAAIRNLKDGK